LRVEPPVGRLHDRPLHLLIIGQHKRGVVEMRRVVVDRGDIGLKLSREMQPQRVEVAHFIPFAVVFHPKRQPGRAYRAFTLFLTRQFALR
jgi:hypothetical protein